MTRHACEVWAEQGWCQHTRPDPIATNLTVLENVSDGIASMREALRGVRLSMPTFRLPGGRP